MKYAGVFLEELRKLSMQFDRVSEHPLYRHLLPAHQKMGNSFFASFLSEDSRNVDQRLAETMEILKDQAEALGFGHSNLSSVIQIVENITRSKPASLRFKCVTDIITWQDIA